MADPVDLDALARRYAPPDPGHCMQCGRPLERASVREARASWRCPSHRSAPGGQLRPVGCVTMCAETWAGDPDVLALVAEVRAMRLRVFPVEVARA